MCFDVLDLDADAVCKTATDKTAKGTTKKEQIFNSN
jgi:hypothetical protein